MVNPENVRVACRHFIPKDRNVIAALKSAKELTLIDVGNHKSWQVSFDVQDSDLIQVEYAPKTHVVRCPVNPFCLANCNGVAEVEPADESGMKTIFRNR